MELAIYTTPPLDFSPTIQATACHVEYSGKILLLKRSQNKTLGGSWGLVGGKIEQDETPLQSILRETKEEIGIELCPEDLVHMPLLYVRRSDADVELHRFKITLTSEPNIILDLSEHSEYRWFTIEEAKQLVHVTGAVKALRYAL